MAERISVIIPVYNLSAELPRCLDSVLAQSYTDIEIIAVDDGSPDNSGEILDCYAAKYPNIRVIHKENGGVTSARLRGIDEATGEWIGFVDGDDEIERDMYARLLNNAKNYDAQISHCGYQMHFKDGRVHHFHNTGLVLKQDKTSALKELLSGLRVEPGLWNKLFHRSLFRSLLRSEAVDVNIKINEDLLMNFYLFSAAEQTVFEDWCPYHYISREGSASRAKLSEHKIYDPIRVKEIIMEKAPEELREDALRAYINTCINTYHTLLLAGAEYNEDLQKVRQLIIREKASYRILGRKRKMMALLLSSAPQIYRSIYGLYSRFLQRDIYC